MLNLSSRRLAESDRFLKRVILTRSEPSLNLSLGTCLLVTMHPSFDGRTLFPLLTDGRLMFALAATAALLFSLGMEVRSYDEKITVQDLSDDLAYQYANQQQLFTDTGDLRFVRFGNHQLNFSIEQRLSLSYGNVDVERLEETSLAGVIG